MLDSTSMYQVIEIIYNDGAFAIAKGYWNGEKDQIRLACRWHEEDAIGYPQTFGKPQWMMLPCNGLDLNIINALSKSPKVTLTFG